MERKNVLYRLALVIAVIMAAVSPFWARQVGKASMKVAEPIYDFGMVKENGGPVSHEFEFVNEGNANLIIYEAKADCGCTTPEYPEAPSAPGKGGKIKVTYNPLGRPGSFSKVVTVKTNGSPSKIRLKVRGTVVPK